ncbi:hypothetical protein BGW36DRAFT_376942, partial [Talaromyces proteolyticus]
MASMPKRSNVACDSCRSHKRKCNGGAPCAGCIRRQVECAYSAIGKGSQARLAATSLRLNSQVRQSNDAGSLTVARRTSSQPRSKAPTSSGPSLYNSRQKPLQVDVEDGSALPPLTIPLGHRCTNNSLLVLPQVQSLIGQYPEDFFYRVESQRSLPSTQWFNPISDYLELPQVDQDTALALISNFFQSAHLVNFFLDQDTFLARYVYGLTPADASLNDRAILHAVFALGSVAGKTIDSKDVLDKDTPGMEYFKPALHILTTSWTTSFSGEINLSQGLVLCALYLCNIAQPLRAWKLIHLASTTVQQILLRSDDTLNPADNDEIFRVAWSCFCIESDLLSEFHQPRSGILHIMDEMRFPSLGQAPMPANLAFLAEISIRLLLNRVHYSIYSADSLTEVPGGSLISICTELDRQLNNWYDALPNTVRPDLSSPEDANFQSYILRLRYWSAKDIIFRPFVFYVTSLPADTYVSDIILDKCQICLSSCRYWLLSTKKLLSQHTSWAYSALSTVFGSSLVLSLAAISPRLQSFVPNISELQNFAIERLKPWALPGTSVECALEILISVQKKLRYR